MISGQRWRILIFVVPPVQKQKIINVPKRIRVSIIIISMHVILNKNNRIVFI